jgi:hypothetical protein
MAAAGWEAGTRHRPRGDARLGLSLLFPRPKPREPGTLYPAFCGHQAVRETLTGSVEARGLPARTTRTEAVRALGRAGR